MPFRGLLGVHSGYGLPARGVAYATLFTEGFSACRYLLAPLRLLPAGTTVAGRDSHPLKMHDFSRRTRMGRAMASEFPNSMNQLSPGDAVSGSEVATTDASSVGVISDKPHSFPWYALVLYAIALCAVALTYSLITQHVWEDALITLRCAENLVNGKGLTYHEGTRVHTFTSPINVLVLALCYLLTGKGTYVATLWMYRVFSIAAFAGSGALLLQAAARATPRWSLSLWWLAIAYMFDAKSVCFSSNGMETAYMLLFVGWAVYLLSPSRPERWLARGVCWAGIMWTRPDGCVYLAAFACAELIFSGFPRKQVLGALTKSAAVCAVAYGPWILWAWIYYGSPVPHTIIAKTDPAGVMAQFWTFVDRVPEHVLGIAAHCFRYVYSQLGPLLETAFYQRLIEVITKCVGLLSIGYWVWPKGDRLGRTTSFCFAFLCTYFSFQSFTGPWYFPPATLLGYVTLERAFATFAAIYCPTARQARVKAVLVAALVLLAVGQFILFALTTREMQIQQAEIESGTRAQVGIWLRDHGKPGDTVYLEPLGYIGYLSGLTMHDYPGLASPTVVKVRHEKQVDFLGAIPEVMADWVVLRLHEFQSLNSSPEGKSFQEHYELAQQFNSFPNFKKYGFIPGQAYILIDASFGIFRRKTEVLFP